MAFSPADVSRASLELVCVCVCLVLSARCVVCVLG